MVPKSPSDLEQHPPRNQTAGPDSDESLDERLGWVIEVNQQLLEESGHAKEPSAVEDRLLDRLFRIQESERRLLAHEIHDGIAQLLVGALMQIEILDSRCSDCREPNSTAFSHLRQWLQRALEEARYLVDDLHPPVAGDTSLRSAIDFLVISHLTEQPPVEIAFSTNLDGHRFDRLFEDAVFRLIRKALAVAVAHGNTRRMELIARVENERLHLELRDWRRSDEDDGRARARLDLATIRERVRLLHGTFAVDFAGDSELTFQVSLPIPRSLGRVP